MKPEDLFTPKQLESWWQWEWGVFVDHRADGFGAAFVSRHQDETGAREAAEDTANHYPGEPVLIARRRVTYDPWDSVQVVVAPRAADHA